MPNNFIGGGQIFLHKIRMFIQVIDKAIHFCFFLSLIIICILYYSTLNKQDLKAAWTYQKAYGILYFDEAMEPLLHSVNPRRSERPAIINAHTKHGLYARDIECQRVLKNHIFIAPYEKVMRIAKEALMVWIGIFVITFILIYALWTRFGYKAQEKRLLEGGRILTPKQATNYLRRTGQASSIVIAGMPLMKDRETSHILVSGTTGSGKTNLFNHILPEVSRLKHSALIVDQTGEMIARYYNRERGDIIFNPLDARSHGWDFWEDVVGEFNPSGMNENLEKFAKILFGANRRNGMARSDPFWEESAQVIFCDSVKYLARKGDKKFSSLINLISMADLKELRSKLKGSEAFRYLTADNNITAGSILSVVTTSCKPLKYLFESESKFSLKGYFQNIDKGNPAWLFLSTPPHLREVIMPLISSMLELSMSQLMGLGSNENRRIWFILDELASLGRLSSITSLLTESRKYGGCVLAALQSYNQLIGNYGHNLGPAMLGQFGTQFTFRCQEPQLAKLMSETYGTIKQARQQKNTSYGAHEYRDGISYTEQENREALIQPKEFLKLNNLECFVSLPDPNIDIIKMQTTIAKIPILNKNFEQAERSFMEPDSSTTNNELMEEDEALATSFRKDKLLIV